MTRARVAGNMSVVKRPLVLALALATSCGTPAALSSPAPSPTAATTEAPSASPAPQRLPGSSIRVLVDGVEQPGGAVHPVKAGPVTVTLAFPVDVDRASVERWLSGYALNWVDDGTLEIVVPEAQDSVSFKFPEIASRDGRAVIDLLVVFVAFPPTRLLRIYAAAELAKASTDFAHPATAVSSQRVHLGRRAGGALSPDARTILFFDDADRNAPVPYLLDVATDAPRRLAPPAADGPFVYAGWLADGRLLLVGKRAWVGDAGGAGMRVVADVRTPDGAPSSAEPSRDGRVALEYGDRLAILDLATGAIAPLGEGFRRCPSALATSFTWSADGARVAGVDCDPSAAGSSVRIVDVRSSRVVATAVPGVQSVSTFPTGELLAIGPSELTGEGAPSIGHLLDFDGREKARYRGGWWWASADGRYLLEMEPTGGAASSLGTSYTLIDRRTGATTAHFLPWTVVWLPDGRLAAF